MPPLHQFSLVDGTAPALKYGHIISIDLDLFSQLPFDNNESKCHFRERKEKRFLGYF